MSQLQERTGIYMEWNGNRAVLDILRKVKPRALTEKGVENISFREETSCSENFIIEGDNLQVLTSLYKYKGKIDLIYADPPYGTGNKEFRFNDLWLHDPNDDDPGDYVKEEDAGRHTKWLNFMAPRLHMMKRMLKPSGVIAISIDRRELFRLGMLMDDIFREENCLGVINWQKKYSPSNDSKHISPTTEYVLIYAKRENYTETGLLNRTASMNGHYRNPDNDPAGNWRSDNPSVRTWSAKDDYGIQSPFTGEIHYPPPGRSWTYKKSDMKKWLEMWGSPYVEKGDKHRSSKMLVIDEDIEEAKKKAYTMYQKGSWPVLYFMDEGKGRPSTKRYLNQVKQGRVPITFLEEEDYEDILEIGSQSWGYEQSGHTQEGRKVLNAIMGGFHNFTTPKPVKLIKTIIHLWCPPNGIVLDPFAGSGTAAHAILELNAETGSQRKFILIESGNPKEHDYFARTLTAERVRRVITGNWDSGKRLGLPGGFTFKTKGKAIDEDAIMSMQREELIEVISQADDNNTGRASWVERIPDDSQYIYLFGKNRSGQGICLLWDRESIVTKEVIRQAYKEVKEAGLKTPFRMYGRSKRFSDESFIFLQIPDEIINQLGISE